MQRKTVGVTAFTALLVLTPVSQASNYSGEWVATVTEALSQCETIGKDIVGEYLVEINQDEERIVIQGKGERGLTFVGAFNPKDPTRLKLNTTYSEDGGYVTELIDMEFLDPDHGKGGVVFRWSGDLYSCGGSYLFTLMRKK